MTVEDPDATLPEDLRAKTPAAADTRGPTVGHFELRRKLGEGGMGVVYVGRDATLGRDVAIKLVQGTARSSGIHARLIREAQAMAQVSHPNVVPIYEVGPHEDGIFIAMELIEGETLGAWLKRERRPLRDVLDKMIQAGNGLSAAHRAGILHRDFKLENVMVGRKDGRARVMDFGLARAMKDDGDDELPPVSRRSHPPQHALAADLTAEGSVLGTPSYMSPEHFAGTFTKASDQWSYAVSLYRAFFRVAPFRGKDLVELEEAITNGPLPTPPPNKVPKSVTAAILRAFARDPKDRWATIQDLVNVLAAALENLPDRDRLTSRRQRRIAATALLGLEFLGLAVGHQESAEIRVLFVHSVIAVLITAVIGIVFRRSIMADAHGRRIWLLFFVGGVGAVAHRALALTGGGSVSHVLDGDAISFMVLATYGALTLERWIAIFAFLMAAYIVVSALVPSVAVAAFGFTLLCGIASGLWFWREPSPERVS